MTLFLVLKKNCISAYKKVKWWLQNWWEEPKNHQTHIHHAEIALTILPDVEDLIEASVLHTPIAQELRMCGAQMDLLTGQFVKSCIKVWLDVVGAKFVEGSMLLLRAS